jgi:CheY-like chemotaxis protein
MTYDRLPIRVLVVDDDAALREAYSQILLETDINKDMAGFREIRARLFNKPEAAGAPARARPKAASFDPVFCSQAEAAVAAVQQSLNEDRPFAAVARINGGAPETAEVPGMVNFAMGY